MSQFRVSTACDPIDLVSALQARQPPEQVGRDGHVGPARPEGHRHRLGPQDQQVKYLSRNNKIKPHLQHLLEPRNI